MSIDKLYNHLITKDNSFNFDLFKENGDLLSQCFNLILSKFKLFNNRVEIYNCINEFLFEANETHCWLGCEDYPHKILSMDEALKKDRIYTLDIAFSRENLWVDGAFSFGYGSLSMRQRQLLEHINDSMKYQISEITPGKRFQTLVENYSWNKENIHLEATMGGHGISSNLHEYPDLIYSDPGEYQFEENHPFTVEPVFHIKTDGLKIYGYDEKTLCLRGLNVYAFPSIEKIFRYLS